MAIKPRQQTTYITDRLSPHYQVAFNNRDDFTLSLDLSAKYPNAPLEERQFEESIEEVLARVNAYHSASIFKRWQLRLTTPVAHDQAKLLLVRPAFIKLIDSKVMPRTPQNTLHQRLDNYYREHTYAQPSPTTLIGRVSSFVVSA